MVDAQGLALAHDRLPTVGLTIQVDAVDRVEEVERTPHLLFYTIHQRSHALRAELLLEVGDRRSRIEAELLVHEEIVAYAILDRHGVTRSERPTKAVYPAEERQA